jgi:putative redox protein
MSTAQARIGTSTYRTTISAGKHILFADEPESLGGTDTAPDPSQLLLSSLGACTAITLRMYADRKAWDVQEIHVDLAMTSDNTPAGKHTAITRKLSFTGNLTDEQQERLMQIANACPLHKTLIGTITIDTSL